MKRDKTADERRHLERVAQFPCALCAFLRLGESVAELHHARVRHGWGRSSHYAVIPLCPTHHTGKNGVHDLGREEFTAHHGISEIALLEITLSRLGMSTVICE